MRLRHRTLVLPMAVSVLVVASAAYVGARGRFASRASAGDRPVPRAARPSGAVTATPVRAAFVRRDTLVLFVTAAAQAAAARRVVVLAEVAGRVTGVAVHDDAPVRRGAVLVTLDGADYRLAVARAEADLRQAEAQYRELTVFDDRLESAELRRERSRAASAKSGRDAARVLLEKAQLDERRTVVVAPFAGHVADVRVTPGQWVRAGDELLTVLDLDPIRVEVQVLESEVGALGVGRTAAVRFAAYPDELFTARITSINPLVDSETRTARATVTVPNADRRILPGMYARVALEVRRLAGRVLVPRAALLERDRRTLVFVYHGDTSGRAPGTAEWRYVTAGVGNDSLVEILPASRRDRVEPGEIVLVEGHESLVHGAPVRLTSSARQPGELRK